MREFLRRLFIFLLATVCCIPLIWAFIKGVNQNIKVCFNDYASTNAKVISYRNKSGDGYEWSEIKLEYYSSKNKRDTISTLYYAKLTDSDSFIKLYFNKDNKSKFVTKNKLIYDNFFLVLYSVGIFFLLYLFVRCIKSLKFLKIKQS